MGAPLKWTHNGVSPDKALVANSYVAQSFSIGGRARNGQPRVPSYAVDLHLAFDTCTAFKVKLTRKIAPLAADAVPTAIELYSTSHNDDLAFGGISPAQTKEHVYTKPAAWANTHAYVVGDRVTNDTGKSYLCITAGTSAGSGGPTGVTSDITDGGAHWRYVGLAASFDDVLEFTASDVPATVDVCVEAIGTVGTNDAAQAYLGG